MNCFRVGGTSRAAGDRFPSNPDQLRRCLRPMGLRQQTSISARTWAGSLQLIVITVIPRHPDKPPHRLSSVTSLSVRPVMFLSVIYKETAHNLFLEN
jgi:hypothetical protein